AAFTGNHRSTGRHRKPHEINTSQWRDEFDVVRSFLAASLISSRLSRLSRLWKLAISTDLPAELVGHSRKPRTNTTVGQIGNLQPNGIRPIFVELFSWQVQEFRHFPQRCRHDDTEIVWGSLQAADRIHPVQPTPVGQAHKVGSPR